MTERPNRANHIRRAPASGRNLPARYRRPFWLPATNYYILAAAVALALFFMVWGILHEGEENIPWVPAGISASFVLIAAVFLREIVLRKARNRFLLVQKRLDYNLDSAAKRTAASTVDRKLSLERNSEIVREIKRKSEAAKVFMRIGDGHFEVFEICREYLEINRRELEKAGAGSPRLAGLLRGRKVVKELKRFHLLTWAEVESRHLTSDAKTSVTLSEKTETAQKALNVIRLALEHYPEEMRLAESEQAVVDFITSIRVGHFVEQAERSAFKGNHKRAVSHYKDALFFLAREATPNSETELLAQKINAEIQKILEIPTEPKKLRSLKRND